MKKARKKVLKKWDAPSKVKVNKKEDTVERRLECYQTAANATWAYRCGVYFDVQSLGRTLRILGFEAGAHGGDRSSSLYVCTKGSSSGNELDQSCWSLVWQGVLKEKKDTAIRLKSALTLAPGERLGFLLHSNQYALYHSENGKTAQDEYIAIIPSFRSNEERVLEPFVKNYLSSDRATHAGSVIYETITSDNAPAIDINEENLKNAFENALLEGKAPLLRAKLCFVGQGRAGKTTTVKALLGQPFDENEKSTIGASTSTCEIDRTETCDFQSVHKDTSAEFEAHRKRAAVSSLAAAVVEKKQHSDSYNKFGQIDLIEKLKHIGNTISSEVATTQDNSSIPISSKVKSATSSEEVSKTEDNEALKKAQACTKAFAATARAEAEEAAKKMNSIDIAAEVASFSQGKEESKLRMSVWDYGGQRVFYSLHHLFLTRHAVYVCVFDMRTLASGEEATKKSLESLAFLLFWLRSLKLHASGAPIALVGTHKDTVSSYDDHRAIHDQILEFFERCENTATARSKLLAPIIENNDLIFFPVDNSVGLSSDNTLRALRTAIRTSVLKQQFVSEAIPCRYLKFLETLEQQEGAWLPLQKASAIAAQYAIYDKDMEAALSKFHEVGVLNFWSDSPTLRQRVILDPQWLLDHISVIIRDNDLHGSSLVSTTDKYLVRCARKLCEEAKLTQGLLNALLPGDDDDRSFLKEMMLRMSIMCPWPSMTSEEQMYLVPSLLIPSKTEVGVEDVLPWSKEQTIIIDFTAFFLPTGLFERLVCMITTACSNQVKLSTIVNATDAWISVDNIEFHLLNDEMKQQIRCEVVLNFVDKSAANSYVLSLILRTMQKLREHFAKNLKFKVLLPSHSTTVSGEVEYCEAHEIDTLAENYLHWKASIIESSSLQNQQKLQKEIPRLEALLRLGRDYARKVMEPDLVQYNATWNQLRLGELDELLELETHINRLTSKMHRASLKQPSFGQSDATILNDNYLDALYEACAQAQEDYYTQISTLVSDIESLEFVAAPSLKRRSRSLEKIRLKYFGDCSRIRDVLRCKCVITNVKTMNHFVRTLEGHQDSFQIVSLKNKLSESFDADALSGGYRDLNFNLQLSNGLLVELQCHLKAFENAQEKLRTSKSNNLSGHDRYVIFRRVNERLEFQKHRISNLLEKASSQPKNKSEEAPRGLVAALRNEVATLRAELAETKRTVEAMQATINNTHCEDLRFQAGCAISEQDASSVPVSS